MTDYERDALWYDHINEELLDEYALDRVPEGKVKDSIEEHLLICVYCQDRLQLIDSLRAALGRGTLQNDSEDPNG
jgi:hypothetical protein